MAQIIESIPNISNGRDKEVIEACVDQIRNTPGCTLLDYSSDESHNRSVITYIGNAEAVEEASVKLVKKAAERIDLNHHTGEHEAGVPVFLYEQSATRPERQNLVTIRKGQFEGMAEKVQQPDWEPDFGGRRIHPTAGVMAVGARPPLVAFNLDLDTEDVQIAKNIAKIIREKDGGFKCVKSMGFEIEDEETGKKYAQVSCNMTNYQQTPLYRVVETVKTEAARYGVHITKCEIVGLCPMKALTDCAEYYMQLNDFDFDKQVLENHII